MSGQQNRKIIQCIYFLCALLFSISEMSCGGSSSSLSSSAGSSGTSGDSNEQTTDTVIGGNVQTMSIVDGGSEMDLSDVASDEDVMLLIYSFNETTSTSAAFQIAGSENEKVQLVDDFAFLTNFDEDEDLTEEFHGQLREMESLLEGEIIESANEVVSRYAVTAPSVGSEQTFKVLNSFSSTDSYDTVTATLRVQTDYFNLYVDNRNADSMTDEDLNDIASQFVGVIPLERDMFGNESDINGDGRFDVLLTQTVNSLGGGSGMVTGFFYAIDLYPAATYEVSNEKEVYFTFVPDPNGEYGSAVSKAFAMTNIYPGVLAHEYQHMISFNMHANENSGSAEEGWLNEGLSHLAEDIYSANDSGYMEETGLENPARVSTFLANINNTCFTCGTSLRQRGGSYLFVRYLYEQSELGHFGNVANGAALIDLLLNTSLRGVDNITNALFGDAATDSSFKDTIGLFALAVYFSNTDASEDDRFHFSGINLRSTQDDNRGTSLNGPSIQNVSSFPFTDSLTGSTISYIKATGDTIQGSGGVLEFDFSTNSEFGGYVIRRQ